jgi:hypothetical protein
MKYLMALTRQEKEKLVLELYNQGKTYRQIAEEARICPRDIITILNRVVKRRNPWNPCLYRHNHSNCFPKVNLQYM